MYLSKRYNTHELKDWDSISRLKKLSLVHSEREKIFNFNNWIQINEKLFGRAGGVKIRKPTGNEHDFLYGVNSTEAESMEHKALKGWVAEDSQRVDLACEFGKGHIEARLLSGDEVDVVFSYGNLFRMVEVKSRRSNDDDFRRGIYQCVKYHEVKRAEHVSYEIDVQAILVTERDLSIELKKRAKLLGVVLKKVLMSKL